MVPAALDPSAALVEGGMVGITITVGPIVIVVCNEIVVEIAMVPLSNDVGVGVGVGVVCWAAGCWVRAVCFFFLPPTPPPTAVAMTTKRATTTITTIPFLVR